MSSRLNYGKTFLLGFGFFGLSVVWGVYNAFVPIFLSEKFNLSPVLVGFFMTLDNIAALFIQPPVGAWSDRLRTPLGRRIDESSPLVDARLKPIKLGNQEIHFKFAAPSRLYWAGRPAMRVVQALHWMQDILAQDSERERVLATLSRLFAEPKHGEAIRGDLRAGLSALPIWMQEFLRGLLNPADEEGPQ